MGRIGFQYVRECTVLRHSRSAVWRSWGAIGCVEPRITTRLERTVVRFEAAKKTHSRSIGTLDLLNISEDLALMR
jgi:hypothetical protein